MQLHVKTSKQKWRRGASGSRGKYYARNNRKTRHFAVVCYGNFENIVQVCCNRNPSTDVNKSVWQVAACACFISHCIQCHVCMQFMYFIFFNASGKPVLFRCGELMTVQEVLKTLNLSQSAPCSLLLLMMNVNFHAKKRNIYWFQFPTWGFFTLYASC